MPRKLTQGKRLPAELRWSVDINTPPELRVYNGEGHKLPGKPTPRQVYHALHVGAKIFVPGVGKVRFRCPSHLSNKRWTTRDDWEKWEMLKDKYDHLNGDR